MRHVFQLMKMDTGERSPVVADEATSFATHLREHMVDNEHHAVLVLMDEIDNEWQFSKAPYLLAKTFCDSVIGVKENG